MADEDEETTLSQYVAVINSTLNGFPYPCSDNSAHSGGNTENSKIKGNKKSKIVLPHCISKYRDVNM